MLLARLCPQTLNHLQRREAVPGKPKPPVATPRQSKRLAEKRACQMLEEEQQKRVEHPQESDMAEEREIDPRN